MTGPEVSLALSMAEDLRAGKSLFDLIPDTPAGTVLDAEQMRGWDASHDIDAALVRQLLLLGRPDNAAEPRILMLRGARLRGRLDLGLLTVPIALALHDCLIEDGVDLEFARLPALALLRCRVGHPDLPEPALSAQRLRVDGSVRLHGSLFAAATAGDFVDGAVRLVGACIGGQLSLSNATVCNFASAALHADGLQTGGDLFFDEGFTAEGVGKGGAVRLMGARIGGQVVFRGGSVRNSSGPGLSAERMWTEADVVLAALTVEGAGENGSVRLLGARIGGELSLSGATLRNSSGPALLADRAQIGDVFLDGGLSAEGAGDGGAVRLLVARIDGQLILSDATVCNPSGPALVADGLQTGDLVSLGPRFTAEGSGDGCVVRLAGAHVGGQFSISEVTMRIRSHPSHAWELNGLTYPGVPLLDPARNREAWLELLRSSIPRYAAQPYQHLAAAYRAEGHDRDVRAILIAQRRDQVERGALGRGDRWWAGLTGLLLGYGYQPWRALLYLAGLLAVSVLLAVVLGGHGALVRPVDPAEPCALIEQIGRGLDLGTPFLPRPAPGCETTTSATGIALTISSWVLQFAAWALAALFIAGFTGIVRKT